MRGSIIISWGLVIALAAATYSSIEKVDDGYIVGIGPIWFDPVGEADEIKNKVIRNCSQVNNVGADSGDWKRLKSKLDESNFNALPRKILKQDNWFLIETDLTNAEPLIYLFEQTSNGYQERAGYGGTAAPFKDAPVIRDYLFKQTPTAPLALIRCYDPVGVPFNFH